MMEKKHALMLLLMASLILPAGASPLDNITPGNHTEYTLDFVWNPEHGLYTRWWFDLDADFINPYGFFYSLFLPLLGFFGTWTYFIMWATFCAGFYIYTQDSTMPFVVGLITGAILSVLMGEDALVIMMLVIGFLGAGILTKAVLGRA